MKRVANKVSLLVVAFALICACGCSNKHEEADFDLTDVLPDIDVWVERLHFAVPAKWDFKEAEAGMYIYPDSGGMVLASYSDLPDNAFDEGTYTKFVQGVNSEGSFSFSDRPAKTKAYGGEVLRFEGTASLDGSDYAGWMDYAPRDTELYSIIVLIPSDAYDSTKQAIDQFVRDATYTEPVKREEPEAEPEAEPSMTASQQNAVRMAQQYIGTMGFSYRGLVDQLMYEGFSQEDAEYGALNCGADWNEQAAKAAKQYLDAMAFSHSGLVEQLEFDGFTHEQAEYGVSAVGL